MAHRGWKQRRFCAPSEQRQREHFASSNRRDVPLHQGGWWWWCVCKKKQNYNPKRGMSPSNTSIKTCPSPGTTEGTTAPYAAPNRACDESQVSWVPYFYTNTSHNCTKSPINDTKRDSKYKSTSRMWGACDSQIMTVTRCSLTKAVTPTLPDCCNNTDCCNN